ncbi:hypothetical protein ONS95_003750 [Cadophora gregata]|uniref:uncharacterized protein n=1 Tax=Cadophora gregata TaxID=51156 RepID=UPI0026DC0DC2|nr:uncharacterized protein ONS95_003750 [Cadophora gregata]KAK0107038.1 hypothetical protein ONS95_003750 [Cadophora gregata]
MINGIWNQVSSTIGMASPLTDARDNALNSASPRRNQNLQEYEVTMESTRSDSPPSSPFVPNVSSDSLEERENLSPIKTSRLSAKSPIGREHTSPLKMLKSRTSPTSTSRSPRKDQSPTRSPRKLSSPEKRFPVKPSSPIKVAPSPVKMASPEKHTTVMEQSLNIEDVLRDNEGLTKAIEILEDGDSDDDQPSDNTMLTTVGGGQGHNEEVSMDDTMVSTFSEFSAVPDMTMFAKIGHSPTKFAELGPTPRRPQMNTPATLRRPATRDRSPSPTPRGHSYGRSKDEGNTTNLILDFTEQFNGFAGRAQGQSPTRQARQSPLKSSTMPDLSWASTPSVNRHTMSNLLDFDIPPAPTPRSLPSITPRELESLKSNFLSEISSLKASLSGKEAEVQSLKTAVGDAEKRVGECMEQVREERNLKEQLAADKEDWEKRGREMEAVLRNVKEEIVHGERERDELEGRLEESERRREAAEIMAQEAESKMAAMKAGKTPSSPGHSSSKSGECGCGGRAVEIAVEKVSRELHTLYKEKHETKVSALKKSYERRWDKKIMELENQVEDLSKENEELKLGRDTTMTRVEPKSSLEVTQDLEKAAARDAKTKELEAELEGLAQEIKSVKHDNNDLRKLLDEERVEKSKLVQAVDEMIPLVAAFDDMLANMDSAPANLPESAPAPPTPSQKHSSVENLRGSISRASGLRAPTGIAKPGESRIGRGGFGAPAPAGSSRERSGSGQGGNRPGSGMGYRSGIMSSIEKMGSYKGRGE